MTERTVMAWLLTPLAPTVSLIEVLWTVPLVFFVVVATFVAFATVRDYVRDRRRRIGGLRRLVGACFASIAVALWAITLLLALLGVMALVAPQPLSPQVEAGALWATILFFVMGGCVMAANVFLWRLRLGLRAPRPSSVGK